MNDRSLLHAVLVLAVLSLASNVLVLKSLGTQEQEIAPPANSAASAAFFREILQIKSSVQQLISNGNISEGDRDDILDQLNDLKERIISSKQLNEVEKVQLRSIIDNLSTVVEANS